APVHAVVSGGPDPACRDGGIEAMVPGVVGVAGDPAREPREAVAVGRGVVGIVGVERALAERAPVTRCERRSRARRGLAQLRALEAGGGGIGAEAGPGRLG